MENLNISVLLLADELINRVITYLRKYHYGNYVYGVISNLVTCNF